MSRAARAACILVLGGNALLVLAGGIFAILSPSQLDYGEPYVVSAIVHLARGGDLYAAVDDLPFRHNNYNPLFQILGVPLALVTGPHFVPFRILAFACVVLAAATSARLVLRVTASRTAAVLAALLPFASAVCFPFMFLARVDALAALLSAGTVAASVLLRGRSRFLVPVLGFLAFTAKQTALAGLAAHILHAILARRYREALCHGALAAILAGLFILTTSVLSEGRFLRHTVTYHLAHDRVPIVGAHLGVPRLVLALGPLLLVGAAAAALAGRHRPPGAMLLHAALAPLFAIALLTKSGSNLNTFIEPVLSLSAATAVGAAHWLRRPRTAVAAALVAVLLTAPAAREHFGHARSLRRRVAAGPTLPAPVRELLRDPGGPPPLFLGLLGAEAIQAGHEAVFDMADFVRLMDAGLWSAENILRHVREGRFPVIGIPKPKGGRSVEREFDPASLTGFPEAVDRHYERLCETEAAVYYRPRR